MKPDVAVRTQCDRHQQSETTACFRPNAEPSLFECGQQRCQQIEPGNSQPIGGGTRRQKILLRFPSDIQRQTQPAGCSAPSTSSVSKRFSACFCSDSETDTRWLRSPFQQEMLHPQWAVPGCIRILAGTVPDLGQTGRLRYEGIQRASQRAAGYVGAIQAVGQNVAIRLFRQAAAYSDRGCRRKLDGEEMAFQKGACAWLRLVHASPRFAVR